MKNTIFIIFIVFILFCVFFLGYISKDQIDSLFRMIMEDILQSIPQKKTQVVLASDADKVCADSSQCQTGVCLADLTNEEKELIKTKIIYKDQGKCSGTAIKGACFYEIFNGQANGVCGLY